MVDGMQSVLNQLEVKYGDIYPFKVYDCINEGKFTSEEVTSYFVNLAENVNNIASSECKKRMCEKCSELKTLEVALERYGDDDDCVSAILGYVDACGCKSLFDVVEQADCSRWNRYNTEYMAQIHYYMNL